MTGVQTCALPIWVLKAGHGDGLGQKQFVHAISAEQRKQDGVGGEQLEGCDLADRRDFDLKHFPHSAAAQETSNDVFTDPVHCSSRCAWDSGRPAAMILAAAARAS